jgi:ABC-type taurine transport system ATPase subunit
LVEVGIFRAARVGGEFGLKLREPLECLVAITREECLAVLSQVEDESNFQCLISILPLPVSVGICPAHLAAHKLRE